MYSRLGKFVRRFTDPQVALRLFILLAALLIPATLLPVAAPWLMAAAKAVLGLIGLNLFVCTWLRFATLRPAALVVHLGLLVILAGGLAGASGYVATVNVYEGDTVDRVFRWDSGKDVELGCALRVAGLHVDLYPVPVRVGVLKDGVKAALVTSRTGASFAFGAYTVMPLSIDPWKKSLRIEVRDAGGGVIGSMSTDGVRSLPPGFPLDFKLIAYQEPVVRRMWADLELRQGGRVVAAGTSQVNGPLRWQGTQFVLTSAAADESGRPYAGIQISRDSGLYLVYGGAVLLGVGLLLGLKNWAAALGKRVSPQ